MENNNEREKELVSIQTLADLWDTKERTIRHWITEARRNPSADAFPFIKLPQSRLVRIDLKEAREWRNRGRFKNKYQP